MRSLLEWIIALFTRPARAEPVAGLLTLPISPVDFDQLVATPALALLPTKMDTPEARVMMLAICLQESALAHRWQVVDLKRPDVMGPARGLAQFERGGGVYGVINHQASREYAKVVCEARGIPATVGAVYDALSHDDVLAAAFARLLLWTDPRALPHVDDANSAWGYYIRNWRPGKRRPSAWPVNHAIAARTIV